MYDAAAYMFCQEMLQNSFKLLLFLNISITTHFEQKNDMENTFRIMHIVPMTSADWITNSIHRT